MKAVLNRLEKISEQIEKKINDREAVFDNRSDEWRESEKGEDYEARTEQLQEAYDNLCFSIENLKTFLEV